MVKFVVLSNYRKKQKKKKKERKEGTLVSKEKFKLLKSGKFEVSGPYL